jgi:sterol 24-C-methyltransferase
MHAPCRIHASGGSKKFVCHAPKYPVAVFPGARLLRFRSAPPSAKSNYEALRRLSYSPSSPCSGIYTATSILPVLGGIFVFAMAPARLETEDHSRDASFNKAMHGQSAAQKAGFMAMLSKDTSAQKAAVDEYFKHWDNKGADVETDKDREVCVLRRNPSFLLAEMSSITGEESRIRNLDAAVCSFQSNWFLRGAMLT